jgi:hypothetical protein
MNPFPLPFSSSAKIKTPKRRFFPSPNYPSNPLLSRVFSLLLPAFYL